MKKHIGSALSLLLSLGAFAVHAQADLNVDTFDNVALTADGNGWTLLNPITSFTPTASFDANDPLEIILNLSSPIQLGPNINFGLELEISPDVAVDATVALDPASIEPFPFELDLGQIGGNPNFNLGAEIPETVETVFGPGQFSVTSIDITLSQPSQDPNLSYLDFNVANDVPDSGAALTLLALGFAALVARSRLQIAFAKRQ